MRKVSIKEVAELAGVSIATVSNVINQKGRVSPETIKRVEAVIKEVGFVPSMSARNLKMKRTGLIGVIVPFSMSQKDIRDNPFYWNFMSALDEAAKDEEFFFILRGLADQEEQLAFIRERNLDGIIVVGANPGAPITEKIKEFHVPTVYVDSYLADKDAYQVLIDDRRGMYEATKHLIQLGHKKIAFISGGVHQRGMSYERWMGYKTALEEAGLAEQELFFTPKISIRGGAEFAERLINEYKDVTAIVTGGDIVAVGIMNYLQSQGIKVPNQISIVGFDNSFIAELSVPQLTTVHQSVEDKGFYALQLLMKQMDKEEIEHKTKILPVHLVVRDSTTIKSE